MPSCSACRLLQVKGAVGSDCFSKQCVNVCSFSHVHDGEACISSIIDLAEGLAGSNQLMGLKPERLQQMVDFWRPDLAHGAGIKLTTVQHSAAQLDQEPSRKWRSAPML